MRNKETSSTILGAFHHHNVKFQEHSEVLQSTCVRFIFRSICSAHVFARRYEYL